MKPENQHWVPRFLIRNFADKDGRVFRLDIQADEITKPPPKHAASMANFNVFKIDGENISFEDRLSRIETKAAPILKRLVEQHNLLRLTSDDRRGLADFVAAQSFRTAAFYEGFKDKPDHADFGAIFSQLFDSAFFTADEIARRHWALMVINSDNEFYLGDNPVVLQRTERPRDGSGLGFDVEGVEAFMPISPKCALYMPCRATSAQVIDGYQNALEIQRATLQGSHGESDHLQLAQKVITDARGLFQALTVGEPLEAIAPYIENLNYLQCSWAYTAVYSSRRDFTFARRVFRENPQYRAVPSTTLLEVGRRFIRA